MKRGMLRLAALMFSLILAMSLAACGAAESTAVSQTASSGTLQIEDATSSEAQKEEPTAAPEETASPTETPEATAEPEASAEPEDEPALLDENGSYNTKDEVALYIHQYGKLPKNYITKKAAEKLGWSGGSLEPYAPGCSIGGSHFGNYEGLLPEGHNYTECDIDTAGKKSRGAKRIVFSDDGLIYYTEDHYEHFELLYGEELL